MVTMLIKTIDAGDHWSTMTARPNATGIASTPQRMGKTAAVTDPKASTIRSSVTGRAFNSALCASAALTRRMSALIAASPVQRGVASGCVVRRSEASEVLAARSRGIIASTVSSWESSPTKTNVPPSPLCGRKRGSPVPP